MSASFASSSGHGSSSTPMESLEDGEILIEQQRRHLLAGRTHIRHSTRVAVLFPVFVLAGHEAGGLRPVGTRLAEQRQPFGWAENSKDPCLCDVVFLGYDLFSY